MDRLSAPKEWHPEVQKMIMANIDYRCIDLKNLISVGLQRIHLNKSDKMRKRDEEKAKQERDARNKLLLDAFYAGITIRSNFLDFDFIKKRYEQLSPVAKAKARKEDYGKYDFPATLEKKEIVGFLKLKLESKIDRALKGVLKAQNQTI
jgi:hypothetical protein